MESIHFPEFLRAYNWLYKEGNAIYHRLAGHFGLSDTAFWILYSLREADHPLNQAELSAILCTSKQTVNSALKSLEGEGYIRLESAAGDRRSKEIHLTEKGLLLARESVDQVLALEERATQRLSEEERLAILALGRRHLEALRQGTEALLAVSQNPQEE